MMMMMMMMMMMSTLYSVLSLCINTFLRNRTPPTACRLRALHAIWQESGIV